MSNDTSDHNLKAIRQLLLAAFTADDLRRFLEDHPPFRPIVAEFGLGHGLTDMVDEMVTYCRTHLLLDELLAEVREVNPRQYARFAPELYTPQKVREMELAYLDDLLARYEHWRDHYTPLAGIAEVRAAVKDGPRLDLPMPFIPPGFEKLVERGYGERAEVQRVEVDDLSAAVAEHRRILLLGDPGAGKTTTLWRLCYDYALAARKDAAQPLPLLVPLGGYTGDGPFDAFLGRHLGPLTPYLETLRASGRLILLLDGLNEMPQVDYKERVRRIREALDWQPEERVVVTCRELDYVVELKGLQRVEVSPLDEARIRTFLHNYLGETAGERLCWAMAGGDDEVRALWDTWQRAGGTWLEFWSAKKMPGKVYRQTSFAQRRLWARLRKEPPALLALGRNPYLLLMTAQVYVGSSERLPANRARLFADFVDTLLERERERHPERWLPAERQVEALAALAYGMQVEGGRGTTVERPRAADLLRQAAPGLDAERLLYLATSATLLDADDAVVRFYHQLLQEFFAARELGWRFAAGQAMSRYWPGGRWWEPSGWEETTFLLAGLEPDASKLLAELSSANPVLAARCLLEGDAQVDEGTRTQIVCALIDSMTDAQTPAVARAQAGSTLGRLGDPRPGVGLRPDGLPDIAWCEVPAGPFLMGSDKRRDNGAVDHELPQHEVDLSAYSVSKYPLTNAQYEAFVQDGGYSARWRRCWTEAGWSWKGDRAGPEHYGGVYDLPNHPVVMVRWYEAVAFCRWLTERLREMGELGADKEVRLPAEAEWEKAARGRDGRIYPWGNDFAAEKCNMDDTGIGTTSAVGIFPGGASPYGVHDLSGNVLEWCQSLQWPYPYQAADGRDDLEAEGRRVLRGGAFFDLGRDIRCAYRGSLDPDGWFNFIGIRVVVAPGPSDL